MSVEAEICFNPNVKKCMSVLVHIMDLAVNDNVCTRGFKRVRERVEEFGIQEMLDKKRNIHCIIKRV